MEAGSSTKIYHLGIDLEEPHQTQFGCESQGAHRILADARPLPFFPSLPPIIPRVSGGHHRSSEAARNPTAAYTAPPVFSWHTAYTATLPHTTATMDVGVLRDRIQATLDPNAAIRQQAELDLKHVRVLLDIENAHKSGH